MTAENLWESWRHFSLF